MLKLFHESPYSILSFSLFVGADYIQLLCQREPLAILIYIYVGVVFNNVDEWWGRDVGKRIVNNLTLPPELLQAKPELASALLWAQCQVATTPDSDRILFWRIFVSSAQHAQDPR